MSDYRILVGDVRDRLKELDDESVQCVVTSPPYWGLRDYGDDDQLGLEPTPELYVQHMVEVFREVRRVLRADGTLWLNLGDSYASTAVGYGNSGGSYESERNWGDVERTKRDIPAGLKPKDLVGIPWRVAFALQSDGWWLRSDIIWAKPNPMPESVTDRPTKAHEYIFLLTKSARYFYDADAVRERGSFNEGHKRRAFTSPRAKAMGREPSGNEVDGWVTETGYRNKRDVWTITTKPFPGAHFAVFPPELPTLCIKAGTRTAGRRCDCATIISTPTGTGEIDDMTLQIGRAGMSRPRRDNGGIRPITRREQRHHAEQMKASPHRAEMEAMSGPAFAHYIRTDSSGARPLPEWLRGSFVANGWITDPTPCDCPTCPPDTVLDPFAGAGTTGVVCSKLGRDFIGIELNPEYAEMARKRVHDAPLSLFAPGRDT